MLKQTIYISNPLYLCVKNEQLILSNKTTGEVTSLPLEDLGFVIFDCKQILYTHSLIQKFAQYNIATIFCDDSHHPASMLYHLDSNQVQTELFTSQINATEPLKKNLWKQVITAKIKNQALLLSKIGKDSSTLEKYAEEVKSGDPDNREAVASKYYWKSLFDFPKFKRERFGKPPNQLLNYQYAILRASMARALAGSGLLPTLGIHHHNKYNNFCLADDIMEPYRPFADMAILEWINHGNDYTEINKDFKAFALNFLTCDVHFKDMMRPLMIGITFTTASLTKCFQGKLKSINYPILK